MRNGNSTKSHNSHRQLLGLRFFIYSNFYISIVGYASAPVLSQKYLKFLCYMKNLINSFTDFIVVNISVISTVIDIALCLAVLILCSLIRKTLNRNQ